MSVLIGQGAPNFTALALMPDNSVNSEFNLGNYISGKYGVLFFYAVNYSYVCPTELIALNNRIDEFARRDTVVAALSVDSYLSHLHWKRLPQDKGGIGPIKFPLISDMTKEISQTYGVLVNKGLAIRATYIIDRQGYIRNQMIYDFPIGRNIDEILRILDAQQYHEKTGQVCPANWQEGEPGLICDEKNLNLFMRHRADNL